MYERMGVIGQYSSVAGFSAVGVEVFDCNDSSTALQLIRKLTLNEFAVIFIDEALAQQFPDTIEKLKAQPFPIIVPIPLDDSTSSLGMLGIKKDVEKALGVDILFNKED
ncbi:MAG: V-type ATP synthase subunit F [Clostridia bacterium]